MKAKQKVIPRAKPVAARAAGVSELKRPKRSGKQKPKRARARATSRALDLLSTRKPAAKRKAAKRKVAGRRTRSAVHNRKIRVKLPEVLLEGDRPADPQRGGLGEKFALGPIFPAQSFPEPTAQLPESYGTGTLLLTARDPHWIYAHWDFTRAQQVRHNRRSKDGHLVLRLNYAPPAGGLAVEIHVHPESRHWFAHVERAGTKYTADIGYYNKRRQWVQLASSSATLTPAETVSADASTQFATIPYGVSLATLAEAVQQAGLHHKPLACALEELRRQGCPALPERLSSADHPSHVWTVAQEHALAEILSLDRNRLLPAGSLAINDLVRRGEAQGVAHLGAELPSGLPAGSAAISSVSSPFGGEQPGAKGFWLKLNAELIIYGATEPGAAVTVGGREIQLRNDGSFSCRFALPNGKFDLPVMALSADGSDGRAAGMKFSRATEARGEVGVLPQDAALQPPIPDSV